jgi:hypothetical protein
MENLYPSRLPEAAAVLRDAVKGTLYNQSETKNIVLNLSGLAAKHLHKESHSVAINL